MNPIHEVIEKLKQARDWFQRIRRGYHGEVVTLTQANADRIERTFRDAPHTERTT